MSARIAFTNPWLLLTTPQFHTSRDAEPPIEFVMWPISEASYVCHDGLSAEQFEWCRHSVNGTLVSSAALMLFAALSSEVYAENPPPDPTQPVLLMTDKEARPSRPHATLCPRAVSRLTDCRSTLRLPTYMPTVPVPRKIHASIYASPLPVLPAYPPP